MKKALTLIGLLGGIVLIAVLARTGGDSDAREVETEVVDARTIRSSILASGQLVYREQVNLRSEVISKVKELNVEEGDSVTKGEVVLRLDPESFRAEVDQNEASVRMQEIAIRKQRLAIENLRRQWERKRTLFRKGLLDEDSFESASNELEMARVELESRQQALSQARAQLEQARERLDKTMVRSPIDGIVTGTFVKEGETVIAGTTNVAGSTLLSIADPSEVLTEVHVDEADIAKVDEGQKAEVHAVAFPDRPLTGTVESIATTARTGQGRQGLSFLVKILLEEAAELPIRTGMSCRAEIFTTGRENAVAVPVEAVVYADDPEKGHVFVVEGGTAQKREVSLGISNDTRQEIVDGLEAGERVVIGPYRTIRTLADGAAVTFETATASAGNETSSTAQATAAQ